MVNDPHSRIVSPPGDPRLKILLQVFHNTPFIYGQTSITGYNYQALKDQLKWNGLEPKRYVNIMNSCLNSYLKGTKSKV